ncbi:MAG: 50S ribosomal protein L39e [Methanobacteriota archaeon]|nr:MAG: 50S ribosomal protein L39e [Euryarchaeota archaeon]
MAKNSLTTKMRLSKKTRQNRRVPNFAIVKSGRKVTRNPKTRNWRRDKLNTRNWRERK